VARFVPLLAGAVGVVVYASSMGVETVDPRFYQLKLFASLLPDRVQYIGPWLFASFVLQGVFSALLMRVVTSTAALQLLGATLFVTAPVLIHRVGHPALVAHWRDTIAFRRSLEGVFSGLNRPPATTVVDPGEAVWLHEYVALRVAGVADPAARDRVLAAIRQITGR